MPSKRTAKQRLQAEADGLGLSTQGTTVQLQSRINATLAASHDTAEAIASRPDAPKASEPAKGIHPMNAALLGGAIGAALHFFG